MEPHNSKRRAAAVVERYRSIGLLGGLLVGGVAGVMIAGPNLREWSFLKSAVTVLGCFSLGGLLGYGAAALVIGTEASPGIAVLSGDSSAGSDGDSGGDGGGGGGDS